MIMHKNYFQYPYRYKFDQEENDDDDLFLDISTVVSTVKNVKTSSMKI